jgi:sporulation protein YlmC with PRC-barrel domain
MHLSELRGRRVVSRATAETLGEVSDLRLSTNPSAVASLQVGKGRKAGSIAWPQIVGVGPDAVVVTDDDAASEQPDTLSPVGRLVLSELGNAAGAVTDVEFDETNGTLISLATDSVLIEGDRILADGPYAIIVAAREGTEFPG